MYEAMDSFLRVDTWHTGHPFDEQRFFKALSAIVRHPEFDSDAMRKYMRSQKKVTTHDGSNGFERVVDELALKASAIQEYLKVTGE